MTEPGGLSVRRPEDKHDLIEALQRSRPHGAFPTYRDAMVFDATVGWGAQRKVPFDAAGGVIEWSTMINRFGTEDLTDVLAYADTQDVEILDPSRLPERIRMFEAYANGGLGVIDDLIKKEALAPAEAVHRLVTGELESSKEPDHDQAPDIRNLGRVFEK